MDGIFFSLFYFYCKSNERKMGEEKEKRKGEWHTEYNRWASMNTQCGVVDRIIYLFIYLLNFYAAHSSRGLWV